MDTSKVVAGDRRPASVGYVAKRLLLGPPLVTRQLRSERLSKPVALGVLSPDCISSSAYGTEEMLVELLPVFGLSAFAILLPITGVILLILVLMTLSYRQVVMVYTKAGGSYVVARENFGPRVAQVAAVALLIDYVVTVAVQAAAGTVAVASALPALGPYSTEITIGVVLLIAYGNLRGLREAGRLFAVPTYLFSATMIITIVVGVIRELIGTLPTYDPSRLHGTYMPSHLSTLAFGMVVLTILRSFANGGSSLTGLEAISNGVGAFHRPEGPNARRVLGMMAAILGFLIAGVSWLAHVTHATPYTSGYPSVISQEVRAVFGASTGGTAAFIVVQAASALILYTGANTSFNGFPYLASFVAEDSFLPRRLTKRGHRLVFSNGILTLTVVAVILLAVTGANVNALVPFYAIGVFTGFTMAGLGMTRYHQHHREAHWRAKLAINLTGGLLSAAVVLVFAIAKFTEGAWVVVVLFPIMWAALIRLNREYRLEARVLNRIGGDTVRAPNYSRHRVFVCVNTVDLAVLQGLRYARSLHPSELTAVHFMVDNLNADQLQRRWERLKVPVRLQIVDCPDRRIPEAAAELVTDTLATAPASTSVSVLLPRRSYAPLLGRLLHDRTADHIARAVSRIPSAAATIIPYDVQAGIRHAFPHLPEERPTRAIEHWRDRLIGPDPSLAEYLAPPSAPDTTPIGRLSAGRRAVVDGRVHEVTDQDWTGRDDSLHRTVTVALTDKTGTLTVELVDPPAGLIVEAGQLLRVSGEPVRRDHLDTLVMTNPDCSVVDDDAADDASR